MGRSGLAVSRRGTYAFGCFYRLGVLVLIGLMAACEAPLKLEGVEANLQKSIRRTDQFQAAASNGAVIVVVGNQGLILSSRDEGASWQRTKLPAWPSLIDVTACPSGLLAALAVEGQVWVSEDDAGSWTPYPIETEEATQAINCDPRNRLWVVGSFASWLTSDDGAASWETDTLDEDLILTNIQFLDDQNAIMAGEFGTVMKSNDGGATWERLPPLIDEFYPQDMYFKDPDEGWIIGLGGAILHTVDGGESWTSQRTATIAPLYGIAPVGDDLYVVGGEAVMLKLRGDRWLRVNHEQPVRLYLRAMLPIGTDRLLVGGRAGALFILRVGDLRVRSPKH